MKLSTVFAACLVICVGIATTPASADRLLIQRVESAEGFELPNRGQSMTEVEAKFGAPSKKLAPRGGQSAAWPVIHRWEYPNFIVYFEDDRVISAVLIKSDDLELGPKPIKE